MTPVTVTQTYNTEKNIKDFGTDDIKQHDNSILALWSTHGL